MRRYQILPFVPATRIRNMPKRRAKKALAWLREHAEVCVNRNGWMPKP